MILNIAILMEIRYQNKNTQEQGISPVIHKMLESCWNLISHSVGDPSQAYIKAQIVVARK